MKNKNLKIAMLGHKRIPSREGGIEIVVEELSTRIAAQGHQVTCYNRKGHHVSGKEFDDSALSEYKGVHLKSVCTIDKKGLAAMSSSFFAALEAAFGNYDVVHFHAEGPCTMLWLPKLFGKSCIATVHGLDHQRAKWGKFARTYIMLGEKCAVKFADEIIVLSEGVQNYFQAIYGRRTRFIPNGVNRPVQRNLELLKAKYPLAAKQGYFLSLARIVPEKGYHYLIEAFKQVKTDKLLVIAGGASDSGEYMEQLKTMAAGDDRIIFTGFVQGQLLEELYSNAYVYTLPSDLEGMPLSLLEAMSYGNCCLTSDIAECAEVVEEKAVTFKKSDVADLHDKLQMLCDKPELVDKYKNEASDFICNKYNWDYIVNRTLDLYRGN
ncbi:glycosyltransferase [Anaerocolumna sedimenticola]|uniref:Glycosyltransferase n=2 Tax=Anaerocolumna sedimenticola TaxID=2696063 RepID=A0A6P1TTJ6_9FIRM|nr:glycosyltransferase [Anaerocolumna sedimenticola]